MQAWWRPTPIWGASTFRQRHGVVTHSDGRVPLCHRGKGAPWSRVSTMTLLRGFGVRPLLPGSSLSPSTFQRRLTAVQWPLGAYSSTLGLDSSVDKYPHHLLGAPA